MCNRRCPEVLLLAYSIALRSLQGFGQHPASFGVRVVAAARFQLVYRRTNDRSKGLAPRGVRSPLQPLPGAGGAPKRLVHRTAVPIV